MTNPLTSVRIPSRPIAGAGRAVGDVTLAGLATLAVQLFANSVGLGGVWALPGVPEALFGATTGAFAFLGKFLRDKGIGTFF